MGATLDRMMLRRLSTVLLGLSLVAAACSGSSGDLNAGSVLQPDDPVGTAAPSAEPEDRPESFAGTDPAPEFPEGLDWLNVDAPLTMASLRGKVVVLDFWTYGCINCIHIIPDLKRLEAEYPDELVVVGVHSAKFENEGDTANIRDIVARYDLEHPVVNDRDFETWRIWGARAWPTLVIIDPAGNIVGGHSGEGIYPIFQPVIDSLVEEFDDQGRIDRTPLEIVLERDAIPDSVLSFPGKVLADATGGRLFVADTNHHRVLVVDLESGEILDVAGSGVPSFDGGDFAEAGFDQPQGMALSDDGSTLYVADTGNHAIRALDLEGRSVTTVLGTGSQARTYPPMQGQGPDVEISSPWDVAISGDGLFVAMAGSHQIWRFDLATGAAQWYVGSGRESTHNGPRLQAELAQPSAVVVLPDGTVAFADSESSAIRFAEPGPDGVTGVMAGSDENLFDFGDIDGVGTEARLQHPLGLDLAGGALWVADTYNSVIKRLDPETFEIERFAGGDQGWSDGVGTDAQFSEPGGVSAAGDLLYVADTNNHAIRRIDLTTGSVDTLVIYGIERFPSADTTSIQTIVAEPISVVAGPGTVLLNVRIPDGYKINELAPSTVDWAGASVVTDDVSIVGPEFPLEFDAVFAEGDLIADLTIYYCTDDAEALCLIEQVRVEAPISIDPGGESVAVLEHRIPDPGI